MKWIPALLCALTLNAQTKKATDFIRVDEDEEAVRLQTSITTYQKKTFPSASSERFISSTRPTSKNPTPASKSKTRSSSK